MSDKIDGVPMTSLEFIDSELLRIRNYENNFDGEDSIAPPADEANGLNNKRSPRSTIRRGRLMPMFAK